MGSAGQEEREFDILQHREGGQQLKGLEDEAYAFAAQGGELAVRKGGCGAPIDPDFSRGREIHCACEVQERTFAAAAAAEQGGYRSGFSR
jgi:hypothetical protein